MSERQHVCFQFVYANRLARKYLTSFLPTWLQHYVFIKLFDSDPGVVIGKRLCGVELDWVPNKSVFLHVSISCMDSTKAAAGSVCHTSN